MAKVYDVAAYILKKCGLMAAMKLQKLVYYSQAWSLVWDDAALFPEQIEAWVNGPVVRALYEEHRGQFTVSEIAKGNPRCLSKNQQDTVDLVINFYGKHNSQYLSDLTHSEAPWRAAREGLGPWERGANIISHESMAEYYSALLADGR